RALAFAKRPENNAKCSLHPRRIQFASMEAVEKSGLDVRPVEIGGIEESLAAIGEVIFDPAQVASLSALIPGRVFRAERNVGEAVNEGDVLALIEASEVGKAKTEFLQAQAQVELKGKTLESTKAVARTGSVPDRQLQDAGAAFKEAHYRLVSAQ